MYDYSAKRTPVQFRNVDKIKSVKLDNYFSFMQGAKPAYRPAGLAILNKMSELRPDSYRDCAFACATFSGKNSNDVWFAQI